MPALNIPPALAVLPGDHWLVELAKTAQMSGLLLSRYVDAQAATALAELEGDRQPFRAFRALAVAIATARKAVAARETLLRATDGTDAETLIADGIGA